MMFDHITSYETYRKRMVDIHERAVEWAMAHQQEFHRTAKRLDLLDDDGTVFFRDDASVEVLMEGLLYETVVKQRKAITAFLADYTERDETDLLLANAMKQARFGLYRVREITPDRSELALEGLTVETADAKLINVGLAQTAKPGVVLAMRLLTLPALAMTSGVCFPFPGAKEKRVVREWWKFQGLDRYAHIYRLNQKDGFDTGYV